MAIPMEPACDGTTRAPTEAERQQASAEWVNNMYDSRLGCILALPASDKAHTDLATDVSVRGANGAKGLIHPEFRIYIGYDAKEDVAYEVCRQSILKHASVPVHIVPIRQKDLREGGLYSRQREPTESTEFSFTRFLTPYLAGYMGWAMFVDCDFLYTADIKELVEQINDKYAVMCVKVSCGIPIQTRVLPNLCRSNPKLTRSHTFCP